MIIYTRMSFSNKITLMQELNFLLVKAIRCF